MSGQYSVATSSTIPSKHDPEGSYVLECLPGPKEVLLPNLETMLVFQC